MAVAIIPLLPACHRLLRKQNQPGQLVKKYAYPPRVVYCAIYVTLTHLSHFTTKLHKTALREIAVVTSEPGLYPGVSGMGLFFSKIGKIVRKENSRGPGKLSNLGILENSLFCAPEDTQKSPENTAYFSKSEWNNSIFHQNHL